ncbi:anti-sigma factor family protein [Desulfurivibrio sp. D14AmB]|uniref:anti-sigma factor family protein n=1 Tax=Desulfurivibrio sp. D14AmB TaxID=3374370 RepID=UPI00376F3B9F
MECKEWAERIDDYLDGYLEPASRGGFDSHLESCRVCRAAVAAEAAWRQTLRQLPVPPMRPGFAERALRGAALANRRPVTIGGGFGLFALLRRLVGGGGEPARNRRPGGRLLLGAGLGGALAAGLVALLLVVSPPREVAQLLREPVQLVSMTVNETRSLDLVFHAPAMVEEAELELRLSDGIRLVNRPQLSEVNWSVRLEAGGNRLPLTVRADQGGEQTLVVRLRQGEQQREFRVQFDIVPGSFRDSTAPQYRAWL